MSNLPRLALLRVNGHKKQPPIPIRVLRVLPNRLEVEAVMTTVLGGRNRVLSKGEKTFVPHWYVRLDEPEPEPKAS